jgi:hypothetical protein
MKELGILPSNMAKFWDRSGEYGLPLGFLYFFESFVDKDSKRQHISPTAFIYFSKKKKKQLSLTSCRTLS